MIKELTSIVGVNNILAHGKEKTRFSHIWKTDIPLTALAVVFPRSTEEVSAIMQLCHKNNQEVVVHGGVTNLVGGVPVTYDLTLENGWFPDLEELSKVCRI